MTAEKAEPTPGPPVAFLIALVALAVGSVAVVVVLHALGVFEPEPAHAPGLRGNALPEAVTDSRAPNVALTDALKGEPFETRDLAGQPFVLTFLYTSCVDVCPLIGADIRDAISGLDGAGKSVTPVIVTVDPQGDTKFAVRSWVDRLGLPENTRYLVGGRDELVPVWRDWYLISQGATSLEARSHNASVWLIDAEQRPRARYSGGEPIPVEDLRSDLATLAAEADPAPGEEGY